MIFIDPPYNTGSDFIYRDDFYYNEEEYSILNGEINDDGERLFKIPMQMEDFILIGVQ